jgi:hypothetical protein
MTGDDFAISLLNGLCVVMDAALMASLVFTAFTSSVMGLVIAIVTFGGGRFLRFAGYPTTAPSAAKGMLLLCVSIWALGFAATYNERKMTFSAATFQ